MARPLARSVDVRDMLCAQALAVVAHAMERLRAGETIEVLYNAADVRQDLLAWAQGRCHIVQEPGESILRLSSR